MQNNSHNTQYIIAFLLVSALGFLFYSMSMPSVSEQNQAQLLINQQNQAQQQAIIEQQQQELAMQKTKAEQESLLTASNTPVTVLATNTSTTTESLSTSTKMSMSADKKEFYRIRMETNFGKINIILNSKIAPKATANFVKLASSGFYDGTKFHRVIKGFMIQGGDPLSKDDSKQDAWGTGGPGYKFEDEIIDPKVYKDGYKRGIVAMANSGPNTNGSQFFIMHQDYALPPNYTIFGSVVYGMSTVVDKIANTKTAGADRPVEPVIIKSVIVEAI